MKSIKWRPVFFIITCVFSTLFGFWNVTQTVSIKLWFKILSLQKMGIMGVAPPSSLSNEIFHAIDLFIAFTVPVGLTWLIYFFIVRYIFPPSKYRLKNISNKYLLKH